MKSSLRLGSRNPSVGNLLGRGRGFTSRGVTTNTNSVLSFWKSVLRNRAPSTGSSPSTGKAFILAVELFLIRPPIAKLWPSASCTVVDARRVVISGKIARAWVVPLPIPTPSRDSSDTSGDTRKLIRPPESTVGVNRKPMPNSFSSSAIRPSASCATGIRILPPARKLPSCPLIAMTFGSASTFTSDSFFSASR